MLICSSKEVTLFLVGVAGPHFTLSGAVFTEIFVSQRFTDYIYLGPLPTF